MDEFDQEFLLDEEPEVDEEEVPTDEDLEEESTGADLTADEEEL